MTAEYPEQGLETKNTESLAGMKDFYRETIPMFLGGAEDQNRVYSPINVYMALTMLAENTAGDTQTQILDLLHTETVDGLRSKANTLWGANIAMMMEYAGLIK